MASFALEILGVTLSVLGWVAAIVACALPMWKVTAFIGPNIVTAQVSWEGIWMSCAVQSTGHMQCKVYDSLLALPQDLQAARALTVISILLGFVGLLVAITGAKYTNCVEDEEAKGRVTVISGVVLLVAALMMLVPVSWAAHVIIVDFYSPFVVEANKRELGASLFLGWSAACLLFLGGSILCCSCPSQSRAVSRPPSSCTSPTRNYV
ncbi:claudin-9-like [Scleropages formosus]|uniref:claudin-9-like n=1 Tax=Scleropages formosus TaxID=113540 RepID=UPI000878BCD7|nr:claudin-9-like [Scleropages formosus]